MDRRIAVIAGVLGAASLWLAGPTTGPDPQDDDGRASPSPPLRSEPPPRSERTTAPSLRDDAGRAQRASQPPPRSEPAIHEPEGSGFPSGDLACLAAEKRAEAVGRILGLVEGVAPHAAVPMAQRLHSLAVQAGPPPSDCEAAPLPLAEIVDALRRTADGIAAEDPDAAAEIRALANDLDG
jgi:hypothetical protein